MVAANVFSVRQVLVQVTQVTCGIFWLIGSALVVRMENTADWEVSGKCLHGLLLAVSGAAWSRAVLGGVCGAPQNVGSW